MKKLNLIIFSLFIFSCTPQTCPSLYHDELNKLTFNGDEAYTGRCAIFIDDKLSSIQQYLNGKDYGKWTFYYSNGKIETKGRFNEFGQRIGKWRYYYKNGRIKQISGFSNGEVSGKWIKYDSIGKVIDETNY